MTYSLMKTSALTSSSLHMGLEPSNTIDCWQTHVFTTVVCMSNQLPEIRLLSCHLLPNLRTCYDLLVITCADTSDRNRNQRDLGNTTSSTNQGPHVNIRDFCPSSCVQNIGIPWPELPTCSNTWAKRIQCLQSSS